VWGAFGAVPKGTNSMGPGQGTRPWAWWWVGPADDHLGMGGPTNPTWRGRRNFLKRGDGQNKKYRSRKELEKKVRSTGGGGRHIGRTLGENDTVEGEGKAEGKR